MVSQHIQGTANALHTWKRTVGGGRGAQLEPQHLHCITVDGRNPAPPGMYKTLQIMW